MGDYEAGCAALSPWWKLGGWPRYAGLHNAAAAELLLVAGTLSGWVASTKTILGGRKPAEALLSAAIALSEQIGETVRAAEARIELACCYYHQGVFDLARITLQAAFTNLPRAEEDLRGIALIRLAVVERLSGNLREALTLLTEATGLMETSQDWPRGRFHLEFANTLKDLGITQEQDVYFEQAFDHYQQALSHFKQVGNNRYTAIVENNFGYLLSSLRRFDDAFLHLDRARHLFEILGDHVRRAQDPRELQRRQPLLLRRRLFSGLFRPEHHHS